MLVIYTCNFSHEFILVPHLDAAKNPWMSRKLISNATVIFSIHLIHIYKHISASGHSFENTDVQILDKDVRWHECGVKESIYERIEKPTLTTKLRFNLSQVWDPALRTVSSHLSDAKQSSQSTSKQSHPSHQQADGNSSVRGGAVVQHAS